MSEQLDRVEAEAEAEALLARLEIGSLPVCPFGIAKKHDIEVLPFDSTEPGVSGLLLRVGNVFGIQYSTRLKLSGFIRFTVAHELAHYFLPGHPEALFPDGDGIHKSRQEFVSADKYERQADFFAASLLMPKRLFLKAANGAGQGLAAIERLSAACDTSLTSTSIRYAQYAQEPVAVIVSTKGRIDYCFMSESLADLRGLQRIRKGDVIPPDSTTGRFLRTPSNVADNKRDEGACGLDLWFDGAPRDLEVNEDVVGLGSYGKTLTVLFADDLPDDDDREEDE